MKAPLFCLTLIIFLTHQAQGIIKARRAWEDEVYFFVTLYDKIDGNLVCGGVIIDHEWVLTAASCAQKPQGMWAVAGSFFTTTLYSTRWQRPVVDYGIIHEKYVQGESQHDIALLHVNESYVWTEYVRPAALPQPGEVPTGEVNFFGVGQVTIGYPTTSLSSDTKRMIVNILDWKDCREQLPQNLILDDRMVCTEQLPRQSLCREDIGGPLVIGRGKNASLLVGIASWAYLPCGMKQYPNLYTQVSLYLDWIKQNIDNAKRF